LDIIVKNLAESTYVFRFAGMKLKYPLKTGIKPAGGFVEGAKNLSPGLVQGGGRLSGKMRLKGGQAKHQR